jgi:hypothetical protein
MNIKLIPLFNDETFPTSDYSKAYLIENDQQEPIGSVEGSVNNYGELVTVVKLHTKEYQKKGIGFYSFKRVFDELNNVVEIKILKGSWCKDGEFQHYEDGMSTNLKIFFSKRALGLTIEESAFETPTGKWAKKIGFEKCDLKKCTEEEVWIDFKK